MKLFVTVIIALAIAVGLAMASINDPGYIVLSREPYVVRLPLLMFVLILFLGFILLYLLLNFIAGIFRAPKRYEKWRARSNENAAQKYTMSGYAGLIEGNWARAEESLLKKLEHNKAPLMNYLGAAYAAQQQGQMARREQYLDEALEKHGGHKLAINLTRARLMFQVGEIPEARNYLENLRKSAAKNVSVIRLLADVYQELGDWPSLVALVPAMKKLGAFSEDELQHREKLAYDNIISAPALLPGESAPPATWKSLPSAKKKDPRMVASYINQLIRAGKLKEAEKGLRTALNRKFDSELIYLYGKVKSPFLEYQIQLAESFIGKHQDDPDLLLTLARLYRYNREYEKSKEFYKQCIAAGGRDEAYMDLAWLLEQMGQTESALFFIKQGMAATSQTNNRTANKVTEGEMVVLKDGGQDIKQVMPVVP